MARDPVDVVRTVLQAINDRSILERTTELFEPSFVRHDLAGVFADSHGPAGAADFVGTIVAAMPDFMIEVRDVFGSAGRVTVLLRMTGTHTGEPLLGAPASGRPLSANALFVYRVANDRVAEAWQMIDGLAVRRAAGLVT